MSEPTLTKRDRSATIWIRNALLALIAALSVVALSACSESTDGDAASSAGSGSGGAGSAGSGSGGAEAAGGAGVDGPSVAESSPIGAFFADDGGMEAAQAEYNVRVETEIAKCMAEQGFEYKPSGLDFRSEADRETSTLTLPAWVAKYGYGVSTSFDSTLAMQSTDPNTVYVQSLSVAEQMLWIQALAGEQGPPTTEEEFSSRPLDQQGCVGVAIKATGLDEVMDGLSDFEDAYQQAEEQLKDNPDVINAQDAWSRCMAEAGFPGYEGQDEPEQDFQERLGKLLAPAQKELSNLSPEEAQAVFTGEAVEADQVPGLDVTALRELQAEEIRTATQDLACYNTHMKDVYEPLRDALQNGLIEEHSEALNAIKNFGS